MSHLEVDLAHIAIDHPLEVALEVGFSVVPELLDDGAHPRPRPGASLQYEKRDSVFD